MTLQRFTNKKTSWWGFGGDEGDLFLAMALAGDDSGIDLLETLCEWDLVEPVDPFVEISGDFPAVNFSIELYPFISPAVIATCLELNDSDRPRIMIDWEQLNRTPERVQFQLTEKQWHCSGSPRAYEIGRFITEQGKVGIITSIQTELTFEDPQYRWPRGDSRWMERELSAAPEVGEVYCSWAVKVEALPGTRPDPKAFRSPIITTPAQWFHELPGVVHPEIMPWDRMLFLWGIDNVVRLTCPPGSLVSLWCYRHEDLTDDGLDTIAGMMKGFTQIQESDRTYENMTRVY